MMNAKTMVRGLVVALLIFSLGGGLAIYQGFQHLKAPPPISDALLNFSVLAMAFVFEGLSFRVAWREFANAPPPCFDCLMIRAASTQAEPALRVAPSPW